MKSIRTWMHVSLLMVAAVWVVGCPSDVGVFIVASPDTLNYGFVNDELTFDVAKAVAVGHPAVVKAQSLDPWITVETTCGDACETKGPADPIRVTVRIDRSGLQLGNNAGQVEVGGMGIVPVLVNINAKSLLVADFEVSNRTPYQLDPVQFMDRSEAEPGWTITEWLWDFGDGTTSPKQTPAPHTFSDAGTYTVSLTVTAVNDTTGAIKTLTETREGYIIAVTKEAPKASFTVVNPHVLVGNMVWFEDTSEAGTSPIIAWKWSFGDGGTSTDQNPSHVYAEPGVYTVSLKATSLHGSTQSEQVDAVTVVAVAPTADFRASDPTPPVNREVQFFDESDPGTAPITAWLWSFGDGATSTQQNPVHVYRVAGTYTVSLTVTTAHGTDTVSKPGYIDARLEGPKANFISERPVVSVLEPVRFADLSDPGSFDIFAWEWSFGDGTMSNQQSPSHVYGAPGTYNVSLRVQTTQGIDTEIKTGYVTIVAATALDTYVHTPDASYQYTLGNFQSKLEYSLQTIQMTAQTWKAGVATPSVWRHKISVVMPHVVTVPKAFLLITSGLVGEVGSFPTVDPVVAEFAVQAKAVVVVIYQEPNEPISFADVPTPRYGHSLVAYTLDKYLNTGDSAWPALLPMTKSVVRAMDTVDAYFGAGKPSGYVVAGGGLNGWTAWLTAAVDSRVQGVIPMAWDMLNMPANLAHQVTIYSPDKDTPRYAPGWSSYVSLNIFPRLDTLQGQQLLGIIDPYSYLARLTLPKLVINATGDQFFPPDSARYYFDALPGDKHLMYEPNADNGLGGYLPVLEETLPWFRAVGNDQVLPRLETTYTSVTDNTTIAVTTDPKAEEGALWVATSLSSDFSLSGGDASLWDTTDTNFTTALGKYFQAVVKRPGRGTRAGYVEVLFPSDVVVRDGTPIPFRFDSQVRLVPEPHL